MSERISATRQLGLEQLEDRLTPATPGLIGYLYQTLLSRSVSLAEGQAWYHATTAAPDGDLFTTIFRSVEHRGFQVDSYYQRILGRSADPGGRAGFANLMAGGGTEADVKTIFYTAPEFTNRFPTVESYVDGVSANILGQQADPTSQAAWVDAITHGQSLTEFVHNLLATPESKVQDVKDAFFQQLKRGASPTDLNIWSTILHQQPTLTTEQIYQSAALSAEAYNNYYGDPDAGTLIAQLLAQHNQQRAAAGVGPLALSPPLTLAAQGHSNYMALTGIFEHDIGPITPETRAHAAGYFGGVGENIALGPRTVDEVMAGWLNSPGHRANILNGGYKVVGFGIARSFDGLLYWTTDFGDK
jgi:uncharacterized protein YkwD